jgi:hypothetical protein
MPARRRRARLLRVGLFALGNWAVFAILPIWEPARVLLLAFALLAFGAGATLGVLGIFISPVVAGAIVIWAELDRHSLSEHRFLASGSLAIVLLVLCGLGGYAVHVLSRRLNAKRKTASPAAAVKTP